MKNNFNNKKGFTLIELLVTISIISILTAVSIIGLTSIRQKSQDTARLAGIRDLQLSLEGYKSVNSRYPTAGDQASSNYIVGDPAFVPFFIVKLPQDPSQSATNGFHYVVSPDQKSYCVGVKNTVVKNSSQPDLVDGAKSWKSCKGPTASSLVF